MLVVCVAVLMRDGFNDPLTWVVEISEYSLLWMTLLGSAWVLRSAGHVRVDLLLQYLGPTGLRICGMISSAAGMLATGIIFVFGVIATWHAYVQGAYKPTITNVPTWMVIIVIPFGALLLCFRFLRLFVEYVSRQRNFGSESPY